MHDGNVIIISTDNIALRVHLRTIAHRSDIFRDLCTLPRTYPVYLTAPSIDTNASRRIGSPHSLYVYAVDNPYSDLRFPPLDARLELRDRSQGTRAMSAPGSPNVPARRVRSKLWLKRVADI